ncbi:MAG: insulinase family protein, partial [Muribaculaceae bacterium]|nr:insulinase family protein [Muribaculaceae bacterium]
TKDSFNVTGLDKGTDIVPATEAIYREVLRAQRGGFTVSEYERARNEYLSHLEKAYNNRSSRESGSYVQEYVNNFVDNEPIPSIEWYYPQMKQFAQMIPVDQINALLKQIVTDDNRVVMIMLPDLEGYKFPTEAELESIMKAVDAEEIVAFVDNVKDEPLIPSLPQPGKVISETANAMWDATEWTLSNGVKVIVKPTKFKEDEIIVRAVANGGMSTVIDKMTVPSYHGLGLVLDSYGIGSYTNSDLQKYLSGKQAGLKIGFSLYQRNVYGTTTPKDLASQMELLYGVFTDLNVSPDEFKATQDLYTGLLRNQEANPQFIFKRDLYKALYKTPYFQAMTAENVQQANRDEILNVAHSQLANAADYTFVIVGNVDLNTLKPLVEQYVATLPANPATATKMVKNADQQFTLTAGSGTSEFTTKMETPQTYVAIIESATMPYTARASRLATIAGQIMSARFIETIREKEGAVYSISASGAVSTPEGLNAVIETSFPMKPEMKDKVLDIIKNEFKAMESNVTEAELSKVKEYLVKTFTANRELNQPWISAISNYIVTGVDIFNGNIEMVNSFTPANVQDFMKLINGQQNYRVVVLDPAE